MSATRYEEKVAEHYRQQAEKLGLDKLSTMPDEVVRNREIEAILGYLKAVAKKNGPLSRVLEVGCGNGYVLSLLAAQFPNVTFDAIDYSTDMVALASSRNLKGCRVERGDVRLLKSPPSTYDAVISERCVINCMDKDDQKKAIGEIHRVLKPRGVCLFLEGFADGLENLNKARAEMGLSSIPMPHHNIFFDKEDFLAGLKGQFNVLKPSDFGDSSLPDFNFLSSHYFMSRVVHAALSKGGDARNSEFVKFFSFVPATGNYASVQLFVLEKI